MTYRPYIESLIIVEILLNILSDFGMLVKRLVPVILRNFVYPHVKISDYNLCTTCSTRSGGGQWEGQEVANSMELSQVVKVLDTFAPTSYAGSWDNVGLLIEPPQKKPIKKILLTNDLTESVMDEAVSETVDMILSYHPPIFRPMKRFTSKSWKERIVLKCAAEGIALYSPHTSWDAIQGGINEWLLLPFGKVKDVEPCEQNYDTRSPQQYTLHLPNGESDTTSLQVNQQSLLQMLSERSASEQQAAKVIKHEAKPIPGVGPGRVANLETPISLNEAVDRVKKHLQLSHIRFALACGEDMAGSDVVKRVGVCAGSGGSVLAGVQANLILTGEMSHHEVLDFVHRGVSVILTDHSNTERGFHTHIREKLESLMDNKVNIMVSKVDRDPLQVM
eukprot:TRINITY_DN1082_c0_g1_i1.p1 TRINITY_DN1082_c0_g1~~TRINITY_DN1082_c0_g1_i1.p1  ORF type:complete len:391 (+),score=71.17 TRINITY_DN1082_c0_g1_i1:214-1386(+)